ncbi:MAG: GGDEF domain-containing protein [Rubrivivax sp.]|nr:GGDEF domain-containing protein [Rubrivivax sp.]MBK7262022.1 GGDEF domain-containing protein [Rubrivivax sp.]MBK8528232.1 GGDEF domain-containing protein [Rubrivivax sp.]
MNEPTTLALESSDVSLFQTLDGVSHPCLILYSGTEPGRRYDLDRGELLMGRGNDADVPVDSRDVSRRHAVLIVSPHSVELRDLGSANCTYVNDVRVIDPLLLKDGDVVRLANVVFRFHDRRSLDALLHDRLYRLATVDPGTGVFNRRYAQESLKLELTRSRRTGDPMALICCDLDHFKSVNDSFGHAAGDLVLKDCAGLLRSQLRAGDIIGRWGGEEFVVLARETTHEQALVLAERLRVAVADHDFMLPVAGAANTTVLHRQTLSMGVAVLEPGMIDEHDLIATADRRLYAAKRAGRNCVVDSD